MIIYVIVRSDARYSITLTTCLMHEMESTNPDHFQVAEPDGVNETLHDYFQDKDCEEFLTVRLNPSIVD